MEGRKKMMEGGTKEGVMGSRGGCWGGRDFVQHLNFTE